MSNGLIKTRLAERSHQRPAFRVMAVGLQWQRRKPSECERISGIDSQIQLEQEGELHWWDTRWTQRSNKFNRTTERRIALGSKCTWSIYLLCSTQNQATPFDPDRQSESTCRFYFFDWITDARVYSSLLLGAVGCRSAARTTLPDGNGLDCIRSTHVVAGNATLLLLLQRKRSFRFCRFPLGCLRSPICSIFFLKFRIGLLSFQLITYRLVN